MENQPAVKDPLSSKYTWKIENFSKLNTERLYSDVFMVGGFKWRVLIFPKGSKVMVDDHLSLYLDSLDFANSAYAKFSLAVVNQINNKETVRKDTQHQFTEQESDWGFMSFMPLRKLNGPHIGYIVNDTCIVEAEFSLNSTDDSKKALTCKSVEAESQIGVPVEIVAPIAEKDQVTASLPEPETQTKVDGIGIEPMVAIEASKEVQLAEQVTDPAMLSTQSAEIAPLFEYPGAGQLFEEGRHRRQGVVHDDEKFEDVGSFSILKTQSSLYKKIWLKYGHIASSQVLGDYSVQVMLVTDIMTSVMDMHHSHLAEVSSSMLDLWENKIKMAEKLEFNIKWLRERFESVKKDFYGDQKLKTTLLEQDLSLLVVMARLTEAKVELKKVQENLSAIETTISPLLSEKKMNLEKGGRGLLFDGLF